MLLVCETFNVDTEHPLIQVADNRALFAEAMQFFGSVKDWNINNFECEVEIEALSPEEAKELFLSRYNELVQQVPP